QLTGLGQRGNVDALDEPDRRVVDPAVRFVRRAYREGRHAHVHFDFRRHPLSGGLHVLRSRTLRTLPDVERHALAFAQVVKPCALARGLVKEILDAVGSGDEPESLVGESLDRPCRVGHETRPSRCAHLRGAVAVQLRSIAFRPRNCATHPSSSLDVRPMRALHLREAMSRADGGLLSRWWGWRSPVGWTNGAPRPPRNLINPNR